jgi:hypothetical protein
MLSYKEYKESLNEAVNPNKKLVLDTAVRLYNQDKSYYAGITVNEVKALIDTPFLDFSASSLLDVFKNVHDKLIEQDFAKKPRTVLGIESDSEVKSKLLAIGKSGAGQSRIILAENYGKRLLQDTFKTISK